MKVLVILLSLACCAFSSPVRQQRAILDDVVIKLEEYGLNALIRVVEVVNNIHDLVTEAKTMAPMLMAKFHEEVDVLLRDLHAVADDIRTFFGKKGVAYSFNVLDELTELTDGTKLSLALKVMTIADRGHKLVKELQNVVPDAEHRLQNLMDKAEDSLKDLTSHVLKDLGGLFESESEPTLREHIAELLKKVEHATHRRILNLLHAVESTLHHIHEKLPHLVPAVERRLEALRDLVRHVVTEVRDHHGLVQHGTSAWDLLGTLTDGTKMGTVVRTAAILDKFNDLVQDVKQAEPRAEAALHHSVTVVTEHAKTFFKHVATLLD